MSDYFIIDTIYLPTVTTQRISEQKKVRRQYGFQKNILLPQMILKFDKIQKKSLLRLKLSVNFVQKEICLTKCQSIINGNTKTIQLKVFAKMQQEIQNQRSSEFTSYFQNLNKLLTIERSYQGTQENRNTSESNKGD